MFRFYLFYHTKIPLTDKKGEPLRARLYAAKSTYLLTEAMWAMRSNTLLE